MTLPHAPRLLVLASLLWTVPAAAQTAEPGPEALTHLREGAPAKNVVQNRFILKEARFEFSPVAGAIPNNPMVKRLLAGMNLSYHFTEQFAANAQFVYSPDLNENDLKGLTNTLVYIANGSEGIDFQQPVDKMILSGIFAAQWAPIYGKINLLGETILNFDLYGVVGLGMLSIQKGYARYDPSSEGAVPVRLDKADKESKFPLALGTGLNFFVNQSVAIKLDARSLLYFDSKPDYGNVASEEEDGNGTRLYNNFIATAGVAFYFPKMSPRIENF